MPTENKEVHDALSDVLGNLLAHAQAERRQAKPYQMLFGTFKDEGIASAIFKAEHEMQRIALDLMQLLEDKCGKKIDNKLFAVIMGLPLAMHLAEKDVEKNEGHIYCVDKTRLLLRTYFYEQLGLDVEQKPFERKPS